MITAINSAINFRAVYKIGNLPLTVAQERTLKQIKSVVDKEAPFDDFVVSSIGTNQLDLIKVHTIKNKENGSYTYDPYGTINIGTYDINHPFKIEDIDLAYKKHNQDLTKTVLIGGAFILGIIGALVGMARGYSKLPQAEKVADTIATKIDTLKSAEILKP